jgi:hypothetical protein
MPADAFAERLHFSTLSHLGQIPAAIAHHRVSTGHFQEATNGGDTDIAFHLIGRSQHLKGPTYRVVNRVHPDSTLQGNLLVRHTGRCEPHDSNLPAGEPCKRSIRMHVMSEVSNPNTAQRGLKRINDQPHLAHIRFPQVCDPFGQSLRVTLRESRVWKAGEEDDGSGRRPSNHEVSEVEAVRPGTEVDIKNESVMVATFKDITGFGG